MNITDVTITAPEPHRTLLIELTKSEADRLDDFLLDGPDWAGDDAHAGGPLAEQLSAFLQSAFSL